MRAIGQTGDAGTNGVSDGTDQGDLAPGTSHQAADDGLGDDLRGLRRRTYAGLRADRPEVFGNPASAAFGIEFGAAEQEAVASITRRRMLEAGLPPGYGDVGVVYQDQYLLLVRDAVRFRDGRLGSYIRFLPAGASAGSVVLPLVGRQVLLVRHFRHAVRTWLWEAPRGFPAPGDPDSAHTATRQLSEELALIPTDLVHLATIHPDAGISASSVDVFAARVIGRQEPDPFEGIDETRRLSPAELDQWIADGQIRDGFTLAACALAGARGLLGPAPEPSPSGPGPDLGWQ